MVYTDTKNLLTRRQKRPGPEERTYSRLPCAEKISGESNAKQILGENTVLENHDSRKTNDFFSQGLDMRSKPHMDLTHLILLLYTHANTQRLITPFCS